MDKNMSKIMAALVVVACAALAFTNPGENAHKDVVYQKLSGEAGMRLVDRTTLTRVLQEQELNLTGLVDTQQAVKVGKLVGARILVVGKAFPMGKKLFITAKLIGTETSLVDGVIVKGELGGDVGELTIELAEKLGRRLREVGSKLVAQDDLANDPLPALKAALAGIKKPTIAVIIKEEHVASRRAVVDPAVETEVKRLLRACGFEIKDVKENALADFAKDPRGLAGGSWPRGLQGVDVVIVGEGFSEFAARIGNLVNCVARAEVNVITRADGKIVLADRATQRAVDLSENVAGKKALQKTGRELGIRILEHFRKTLGQKSSSGK